MQKTIKVAPSNSLVLVMDRTVGVIPEKMGGALVSSTPTCIAIGTLSEDDGSTSITLLDEVRPSGLGAAPVFDGVLKTPSRVLSVCSVLDDVLLEMTVISGETRVRVWTNDAAEPDEITVMADPGQPDSWKTRR